MQSVLSWQRIRLANWMASSGDEWIGTFARHNSGTYNNQVRVRVWVRGHWRVEMRVPVNSYCYRPQRGTPGEPGGHKDE